MDIINDRIARGLAHRLPALLLALSGCAMSSPSEAADGPIRLDGVATYRERMVLPPDAMLTVVVEDVSRADAPAIELARTVVDSPGAPPMRFAIEYPTASIVAGHRYAVRARIERSGQLLFTTDTFHALPPPDNSSPFELKLVRVGQPPAAASQFENTYWKLLRLGDTEVVVSERQREPHLILQAAPGGQKRAVGFTGCNRMTGSYTLEGDRITFAQMAGTMMACAEGMETEQAFHEALKAAARWVIRGEQLTLLDASGKPLALFESRYLQ